jgi:hypothetical protein
MARGSANEKGICGVSNVSTFFATDVSLRGDVLSRAVLEEAVLDVVESSGIWGSPTVTGSSSCCSSWDLLISSKMLAQSAASAADWGLARIGLTAVFFPVPVGASFYAYI